MAVGAAGGDGRGPGGEADLTNNQKRKQQQQQQVEEEQQQPKWVPGGPGLRPVQVNAETDGREMCARTVTGS